MSKKQITVCCATCCGSGRVELSGRYADTLALLRTMREPVNGATLARMDGRCSGAAMCNRLRRIEHHGLAKSRRDGREVLWTVA